MKAEPEEDYGGGGRVRGEWGRPAGTGAAVATRSGLSAGPAGWGRLDNARALAVDDLTPAVSLRLEEFACPERPFLIADRLTGVKRVWVSILRGFAILQCENAECRQKKLVAFPCKRRGFCPSCMGRRMAEIAANLVDHILPRVPLRQFVFTVPFELRARLAYDGKLLGAVGRIFVDCLLGFHRRTLRTQASTARSVAKEALQT